MSILQRSIALAAISLVAVHARGAEIIPPKPPGYFQDNAGVISKEAALRFNEQLAQFERETSNQIWVVVYSKMQSDDDVAAYAQRVAEAWGVGQKDKRNGVVLFAFIQDRKISLQVGYGLEGALPDAIAYDIRANRITPHFRTGDYEGGIAEGIDSIFKAIRGEYTGSGKTALERRSNNRPAPSFLFFLIFLVVISVISRLMRRLGGYSYSSGRRGPVFIPMGFGGGGGSWSSGGGGGFSGSLGGGGSFGGGGSSGSW
ncbi:MAG: TPM domain-containing protein [Verrucomicrobia bacterium]|nr:TPM domain-containing protein [Verrucomicrobiota bacterium]